MAQPPEETIKRLAAAFGHPRRLGLLFALAEGPGSATSLAKRVGQGLTGRDLEHHLKVLYKSKAISLVEHRKVRGAKEWIYELPEHTGRADACESIPLPILLGLHQTLS